MYNVSVVIDIKKPPYVSIRKFREIMKRNNARLVKGWHRHMLPAHFRQSSAGGGKYGYAARSAEYVEAKRRRSRGRTGNERKFRRGSKAVIEGGRYALVSSGDTRHRAVDFPPTIKAYPTRATLTMHVPEYASMKPRPGKGPNLGKEMTKVTPAEARILRKQLKKRVLKEFDAARSQNHKRVKV